VGAGLLHVHARRWQQAPCLSRSQQCCWHEASLLLLPPTGHPTMHVSFCSAPTTCFVRAVLNWDNVLCAGGAVLGCSLRVPEKHDRNNTTRRSYFHDIAYTGSDVGT
jgi:hypothetical protein